MILVIGFLWSFLTASALAVEDNAQCLSLQCSKRNVFTYNMTLKQKLWTKEIGRPEKFELSFKANVTCVAENYLTPYQSHGLKYHVEVYNLSSTSNFGANNQFSQSHSVFKQFEHPFYFVQLSNGTVLHVLQVHDDDFQVTNFKKSLASLFQTSLCKGNSDVVEEGSNSKRKAHYTVVQTANRRLSVRKRYKSSDVEKFPTGFDAKPSDLEYSESQETILSQRSMMPIKMTGVLQTSLYQKHHGSSSEHLPTNRIRVRQDFSVRLLRRHKVQQKRSADFVTVEDTHGLQVSSVEGKQVKAVVIKQKLDMSRSKLPDVRLLLENLEENYSRVYDSIAPLVELEGLCEQHLCSSEVKTPVSDAVVDAFFTRASQRERLLPLLVASGTRSARQAIAALLEDPLSSGVSPTNLLSSVSYLRNPSDRILLLVTRLINERGDAFVEEAALALGALARSAAEPASSIAVRFLLDKLHSSSVVSEKVAFLLALGNAGNVDAVEPIVEAMESGMTSKEVREAAALAISHLAEVDQLRVDNLLLDHFKRNSSKAQCILRILSKRSWSEGSSSRISIELEKALAEVTLTNNSQEMKNMQANSKKRLRRDLVSADWADSNPLYNRIASQSSRKDEKNHYKSHIARLYGTTFGNSSSFNMSFVTGIFAGANLDDDPFGLVSAKAVATASVFGYPFDILDAYASLTVNTKTAETATVKQFLRLGSFTVIPYKTSEFSLCSPRSSDIGQTTITLFSLTFDIPLMFAVTASLNLRSAVTFAATLGYEVCPSSSPMFTCLSRPTATLTLGGTASVSAYLLDGGIDVRVSIPFYAEPVVTLRRRQASLGVCLDFNVGQGQGNITISPYYRYRTLFFYWSEKQIIESLAVSIPLKEQEYEGVSYSKCTFF